MGSVTSGTLDPSTGSSTAVYSFSGTAGQNLFLDNNQNPSDPVSLFLYDPYNNQIAYPNQSFDSFQDGGPLTLTASGTYYLLVVGSSTSSIDYQFRLIDTSTSPLTFGSTISGSFSTAVGADVYTFSGTAGETVTFQFQNLNNYLDANFTLFGPDNKIISYPSYGGDLNVTLAAGGNYTLEVSNNPSPSLDSSTYSFEAYQNVDPDRRSRPALS